MNNSDLHGGHGHGDHAAMAASVAHLPPVAYHPLQSCMILLGSLVCSVGFQQQRLAELNSIGFRRAVVLKCTGCFMIFTGFVTAEVTLHHEGLYMPPALVYLPFIFGTLGTTAGLFFFPVNSRRRISANTIFGFFEGFYLRICTILPVTALWLVSNAWESEHALGNLVGHLLPSCFLGLIANLPLQFNVNFDVSKLQRNEGLFALAFAPLMLVIHSVMHRGSFLLFWIIHDLEEDPHKNWMKDQQHTVDLLVWMTSGIVALVMRKLGILTGIHLVLPAVTNVLVMLSHPQDSQTALIMHWGFGISFLFAVTFRVAFRLVEFSWLGTVAAFCFAVSAPELTAWSEKNFVPMTYLILYIIGSSLVWMFHVCLWHGNDALQGYRYLFSLIGSVTLFTCFSSMSPPIFDMREKPVELHEYSAVNDANEEED